MSGDNQTAITMAKVSPEMPESLPLWFQDLGYAVTLPKKRGQEAVKKQILQNVGGVCRAGRVLAIMGPSGAGKTSLLDILAGRKMASCGQLCLGKKVGCDPSEIGRHAAYVQQDDAIMASQTVREALNLAALLTLPSELSYKDKLDRAAGVMKTFSLTDCADTIVGDPNGKMKGISGGERKRCAVAMSAVREPQILFLDEPTSGLDSHKAFVLVKVLKELATTRNSTIVCTLHQPSSDIFAIFDDLMLLLGGNVVFNGPAPRAVTHFAEIGYPCPQFANPTDFLFMHVLVDEDGASAGAERSAELGAAWGQSPERAALELEVSTQLKPVDHGSPAAHSAAPPSVPASSFLQFKVLLMRAMRDVQRNAMRGKAQVGQAVIFAIIIAVIWTQVDNDQNGVQDRAGVIFFMTANGLMNNIMGVLNSFANERGAVLREQENNMYHTLPYFTARVLVDLPMKIFCPTLFGTIAYWSVGFQADAGKFGITLVVLILLALAGNAIGLFLACIFSDVAIALTIAPMVVLPLMMFCGFFLNPESTPVFLKWVEFISPMKYAFSALAMNEFDGLTLYCTDDQLRKGPSTDGTIVKVCPFLSGQMYLDRLNIQSFLTIPMCCLLLAVMTVIFTILAFFALLVVSKRSRAKARASVKLTPAVKLL
ncbi:unnamed protein product [Polarella glacialis]|uniref:ABC transporter domain-containing protein n=1 Tax=Polarella glacialis TaxID=89957 RepID=A0A813H2X2_POLGL|nr:unnamed protein product [Polarella glacialis]